VKTIPLTQGKFAIVDDSDYESVSKFEWCFQPQGGYAERRVKCSDGKHRNKRLHRFLMGDPDGICVDHKNGNGLDNRRENLRLASLKENCRNRVGKHGRILPKGVYKKKGHINRPFMAYIRVNYKLIHLGYYATAEEASRVYDKHAQIYFGQFAKLNNGGDLLPI
jgi:hypothetical protein